MLKKVVFFPDPQAPHTDELKAKLSVKYPCYESRNLAEYNQVFQQSGSFALIFQDAKSALEFLKANSGPLAELEYKVYAYLSVNGTFKEDALKKLKEYRINVYQRSQMDALTENIGLFMSGKDDSIIAVEDIEFIMPKDD